MKIVWTPEAEQDRAAIQAGLELPAGSWRNAAMSDDRATGTMTTNALDALPEPVRWVVWDLDETFWDGTLSEGGIGYRDAHDAIVVALAHRGIVSSICSKNDHAAVVAAFAGRAAWDHFVFPRIDWTAKGPRLKALIETIRLRPQSVLFIDDNPMMRREAAHFVPGLNVADETVIATLLDHPMLQGRPDPDLTRLAHYRLLERRDAEHDAARGDTTGFLRDSGITVSIDYDVEASLDRAIELVNRTNQLNFTKSRLPEEAEAARAHLLWLIRQYDVQSGLVRVRDRYGDYGVVGFYAQRQAVNPGSGLVHFAFSCRTLGMKVETWLYRHLGRPPIDIVGEVATDILDERGPIDWITLAEDDGAVERTAEDRDRASELMLRGGCELLAVSHYCRPLAAEIGGVFATHRDSIQLRFEHSAMACHTLSPPAPDVAASFRALGFQDADFASRLLTDPADDAIWLLSFWGDPVFPLYRHKASGALIPFTAFPAASPFVDLTGFPLADLAPGYDDHWVVDAIRHIAAEYDYVGPIDEAGFAANLRAILARLPARGRAVIIGSNEWFPPLPDGTRYRRDSQVMINRVTQAIVADDPRVAFLPADAYLTGDHDIDGPYADHYVRTVYHRIYGMIDDRLSRRGSEAPRLRGRTGLPKDSPL